MGDKNDDSEYSSIPACRKSQSHHGEGCATQKERLFYEESSVIQSVA